MNTSETTTTLVAAATGEARLAGLAAQAAFRAMFPAGYTPRIDVRLPADVGYVVRKGVAS